MTPLRAAGAVTLGLLIAAPVSAQTSSGGIASVTVSGMAVERDIRASIAASIGYRLNPILALGIELTFVPSFEPDVPDFPTILDGGVSIAGGSSVAIFPPPSIVVRADGGRATIFTGNLRLTIPTRSSRISPYLVGGAGVGNVTDDFHYTFSYPRILPAGPGGGVVFFPTITESIRRSTTDFAMTLGGGVGIRLLDRWSVDVEARYIGVAGQRDINTGRYGAGITFRF